MNAFWKLFTVLVLIHFGCGFSNDSSDRSTRKKRTAAANLAASTDDGDSLSASDTHPTKTQSVSTFEEVIGFFSREIGPVTSEISTEIPTDDTPINVHVIPASEDRAFITLFTTGVSTKPMRVPDSVHDGEHFEFAELFLQLPADWKIDQTEHPLWNWPGDQLRVIGKYPHLNSTWLGKSMSVMSKPTSNPLAWHSNFDAVLLVPEMSFVNERTERTIQLYRLIPLYPEERKLETRQGMAALTLALDRIGMPLIWDFDRPNATK